VASTFVALAAGCAVPAASSLFGLPGTGLLAIAAGAGIGVAAGALLSAQTRRAVNRRSEQVSDQLSADVLAIADRLAADPRCTHQSRSGGPDADLDADGVGARADPSVGSGLGVGSGFGTAVLLPFPRQRAAAPQGADGMSPATKPSGGGSGSAAGPSSALAATGTAARLELIEHSLRQVLLKAACTHDCGSMIDAPGDVVMALRDGRVAEVSGSSLTILGWAAGQLRGQLFTALMHADDRSTFSDLLDGDASAATTGARARPRVRMRSVSGEWHVIEWAIASRQEHGLVVMAGRDVTDQVQMEADLLHQATHDKLTGLPNRAALMNLAAEAVAAAGPAAPLTVVMIDLDRFKDVNDSLGHAVGDQLLAQVGPRLRSALRPHDTIARLGGDEFAVLLPTAGEHGARLVAERLADALDSPFVVDGMDLHVEASIGIAVSHRDARVETATIEGLLREADIAMYRAKQDGAGIALFDPDRDSGQSRTRLELSSELRRAIAEDQLVLHYQPLVDVLEGRMAGVEALVRWQHPERGLLPPGVFLPLAEQTGLIIPLSKIVLSTAVSQAAEWLRAGTPVQIAVNLSPRWLQHADVPEIVERMLAEHDVPPSLLRLEITESVVLVQPEHAMGMLNRLRDMGVGLSLDDFGTGYSSMTHLRNLPVDELKVDRGFVHAMTTSPQDAVIVRAAIELGHNLGMNVVAEGIEDAETLAEVVSAGCALAQGYYFAKPLPPAELIAWARDRFPGFGSSQQPATRAHRSDRLAGTAL
jgi:diguanylate cyclase (GGDEF)-like protein/PAS domain S-box-containing protein